MLVIEIEHGERWGKSGWYAMTRGPWELVMLGVTGESAICDTILEAEGLAIAKALELRKKGYKVKIILDK